MQLQLQALAKEQLSEVRPIFEGYLKEHLTSTDRRVADEEVESWQRIPTETVQELVNALSQKKQWLNFDKVCAAARKCLGVVARCRRAIQPQPSSQGNHREALRLTHLDPNSFTKDAQDQMRKEVLRLCEEMGIPLLKLDFAGGSLYIILTLPTPLENEQKQTFCRGLHEYLKDLPAQTQLVNHQYTMFNICRLRHQPVSLAYLVVSGAQHSGHSGGQSHKSHA